MDSQTLVDVEERKKPNPTDEEGDRQIGPQTRLDSMEKEIARSSYSSSKTGTADSAALQPRCAALT